MLILAIGGWVMSKFDEKKIKDLSSNLKPLRQIAGWTQDELGKMVGVTRQTIASIESNKKVPSITLIIAIMSVFVFKSKKNPMMKTLLNSLKVDKILDELIDDK